MWVMTTKLVFNIGFILFPSTLDFLFKFSAQEQIHLGLPRFGLPSVGCQELENHFEEGIATSYKGPFLESCQNANCRHSHPCLSSFLYLSSSLSSSHKIDPIHSNISGSTRQPPTYYSSRRRFTRNAFDFPRPANRTRVLGNYRENRVYGLA